MALCLALGGHQFDSNPLFRFLSFLPVQEGQGLLTVLGKLMAVELMLGYGGGGGNSTPAGKIEEDAFAVKEAASAGIQSVEKLMRLMSQEQYQEAVADSAINRASMEVGAVADVAVDRAPVAPPPPQPQKTEPVSAFKVYCPNPTRNVRISPLPIHPHPQPQPLERKDAAATSINF
ncbi:hypothetical protein FH972_003311 [Carpinus fangiana]|uniref:Uncharacterized protein n=1 Tax=Carpinus fangiana TaxID=176857 RepID=A0A5N6QKX4_9ROSI|nr:hypothetical protein FH972_003311 [Carpinus fangiana]